MKKLLAIVTMVLFASATFAQTPDPVKESFTRDNPNATGVIWKTEKNNTYRVTYSDNNVERATVYDSKGNVVSRQTAVKDQNIPAGITEYYSKRTTTSTATPGTSTYTVWQSTDANGNVTYYSEYNGKQTWFDKDGKQVTMQGVTETEIQKQEGKMPIDK